MISESNLELLNMSEVMNNLPEKSGLYEIFNKKQKLMYVGISKNIKQRLKSHFADSPGKPSLTKQMYYVRYLLLDIETAEKVEQRLIDLINPFYNGITPYDPYFKDRHYNWIIFPWDRPYFGNDVDTRYDFIVKRNEKRKRKNET